MKWKRLIAGCVVGCAALALLLWKADLSEIGGALRDANPWWIAATLLALGTNLMLRSVRWAHLLTPIGSFGAVRQCFTIYILSYAANILIPLRAGDVVRAVLFGRKFTVSKSAVLTSVAIEHLFDGLAIVIIFALAVGAAETRPSVAASVYLIGGIAVLGFAVAYILAAHDNLAQHLLGWIERLPIRFASRISRSAASALIALQLLRDIRGLLWVTATTLALWSCSWAVTTCIINALGIDLPWHAPLLVIAVANLGFMVPAVPGNIGVAHLLYVSAVVWFGIDLNIAFAFALLLHGIPHFVIVSIGFVAMWYEGLSLRTLPSDK
jgi:glycosyltransferase 2 family protein